jgi:hypothetical protein
MKNFLTPLFIVAGIVIVLWHFGPRLLEILDKATKPPSTNQLVDAILAANKAAADKKTADDKAAAEAAAKNKK